MNIEVITEPFHYVKIVGLYSKEERKQIMRESLSINELGGFVNPSKTGTAHGENNENRKKNTAVLMDRFFSERETSKILKINRKLFNLFYDNLFKDSWLFDSMRFTTDTTLISYYENTDFYKSHRDSAALTALTWFFEEPKCFEGGVFSFPKYNINIEADNETTIIFPSNILHAVSNIEMKKEYLGKNKGRYCMTQFIINEG